MGNENLVRDAVSVGTRRGIVGGAFEAVGRLYAVEVESRIVVAACPGDLEALLRDRAIVRVDGAAGEDILLVTCLQSKLILDAHEAAGII